MNWVMVESAKCIYHDGHNPLWLKVLFTLRIWFVMIYRWKMDLQYVQWVIEHGNYGKNEFEAGLLEMCMFHKCAIATAYMVLEGSTPKTES